MKTGYQQALDYLNSFVDYSKQSGYPYSPERFELGRVEYLLALLGAQAGRGVRTGHSAPYTLQAQKARVPLRR